MTYSEFAIALRAVKNKFIWYVDKKNRLRGFKEIQYKTSIIDDGICPINAVYYYKENILMPSMFAGLIGSKMKLPEWFIDTITYVSDTSSKKIFDKKERVLRKWLMRLMNPIRLFT